MQFMLMCCFNEAAWERLGEAQRGEIMQAYGQLMGQLKQQGRLLAGGRLDSPATGATVRQQHGKALITDGPFAETKEQLGGYHLVECANQAEAVAIAQQIPTLPFGGAVEVRQVVQAE
jgi:hypothetical protein